MERALANYERFTEPKEVLALRSDVVGAEATLGYQTTRLNREQDRLDHYEKLLNSCTIRAPHDGYVVYANNRRRDPEVYEGAPVRERMKLFTLPDQSKMQVEVMLHETVINRVSAGMETRISIEALRVGFLKALCRRSPPCRSRTKDPRRPPVLLISWAGSSSEICRRNCDPTCRPR